MSNKPRAVDGVDLHWLEGKAPSTTTNASAWGVPWAQGEIDKSTALALSTSDGKGVPVQSWPLAYWPDGSLKWTGHAVAADTALSDTVHLAPGSPSEPASPITVKQSGSTITVTTGNFEAQIKSSGTTLISSLSIGGSKKLANGQLVVKVQGQPDEPEASDPANIHTTTANVTAATVESDGPVRATIKVTGTYKGDGHGDWLPFTIRLYFSAGSTAIKIQHLFLFDGDQAKDFIKGIGIKFDVPLSDELYDRHIRFTSASGGLWGEAVRVLSGLRRDATAALLNPQFEGTALPAKVRFGIMARDYYRWARHFTDLERLYVGSTKTSAKGSWIKHAGHGARANGTGYIGGAKGGGVLFGLHNFWQQHPRQLDVRNAGGSTANVTVWAYSPEAPAMDLRHYDTVAHGLDLAYEDVELVTSNPAGIARSYELTLKAVASTPARQAIADFAAVVATPPQLVASPEFYQSHKLFGGRWNVPNKSRSGAAKIENEKSQLLDFYVAEIEQRQFYGFWNYGDVMHTYDDTRHTWRYDVGGYAWDNAELGTDLWLWMSFLRTGRADVFRIAHAMTRHLSEASRLPSHWSVCSRHNVSHWGDGAKEARVSSSTLKRPFYYLTGMLHIS
ncbi:Tat pathway signal sequence domain protein, putative, partial [Rhizoctonia solani AG-3 Rhs1AP]